MKATHIPATLDPDTTLTPAVLLRGAADYLTRNGWIQGDFFDLVTEANYPPACSMGAINFCAHGRAILGSDDTAEDPKTDAAIQAMRVFAAHLNIDYTDPESVAFKTSAVDLIGDWNDDKGRTLAEVVEALHDAANDWETTHHTGGAR